MIKATVTRLPATNVRSLVWIGDALVDWASGGIRYDLDGTVGERLINFGGSFDAATTSPTGRYTVIYTRLGTKGLVLRDGELVREINRSYYCSDAYEYPVCIAQLQDGREVLIHCPEHYNQLEIDDLESGARLTAGPERNSADFFHSRLASSPDGAMLVSAGWVWHPIDEVRAYDIEAALRDPSALDVDGGCAGAWAEESSATFLSDGRLAVALSGIEDDESEVDASTELRLYCLPNTAPLSTIKLSGKAGTMMAVGSNHLLTLYEFPRLININTGLEEQRWPHIASGMQNSSIPAAPLPPPTIALDPLCQRCAIADASGITVLHFLEGASN